MNSSTGILSYSNKYSFWHPVYKSSYIGITKGNITTSGATSNGIGISTIGKSYGRWYWETRMTTFAGNGEMFGITTTTGSNTDILGHVSNSVGIFGPSWEYSKNIGGVYATIGSTFIINSSDIFGLALELNKNSYKLDVYKNGAILYSNITITSSTWYAAITPKGSFNTSFGATGLSYTPPAGYSAGLFNPILEIKLKP